MIEVDAHTLSVDTPKDLDYVRGVLQEKLERGKSNCEHSSVGLYTPGRRVYQRLAVRPQDHRIYLG